MKEQSKSNAFALINRESSLADTAYYQEWQQFSTELGKIANTELFEVDITRPTILYGHIEQFLKKKNRIAAIWGGGGTLARFLSIVDQLAENKTQSAFPILYVPGGKDRLSSPLYASHSSNPKKLAQALIEKPDMETSCLKAHALLSNQVGIDLIALRSVGIQSSPAKLIKKLPWESSLFQWKRKVNQLLAETDTPRLHIRTDTEDIYEGQVYAAEVFNIKRTRHSLSTDEVPSPSHVQLLVVPADDRTRKGMLSISLGLVWERIIAKTKIPVSKQFNPFLYKITASSINMTSLSPKDTGYQHDGDEHADHVEYDSSFSLRDIRTMEITGRNPGIIFRRVIET